jgi:transposase
VSAFAFFSERLRQHVLVEREIGDEPFQSAILVLKRAQLPQLTDAQVGKLLLLCVGIGSWFRATIGMAPVGPLFFCALSHDLDLPPVAVPAVVADLIEAWQHDGRTADRCSTQKCRIDCSFRGPEAMMCIIGVDSHKRSWVAVAVDGSGRVVGEYRGDADATTAADMLRWATELPRVTDSPRWGIEGAMHFGRCLAHAVLAAGMMVVEVPGGATAGERRRSRGRASEKSDVTDALAIAQVTLRDFDQLPPIVRDGEVDRCRALSEHRDNVVLARTAALNQLYAHQGHTDPTATRPFQGRRNRDWLARLAADERPVAVDALTAARLQIQQQLAQVVALYDSQIAALDRELAALATQLAPTLLSMHGVGPISAAEIAGIVGHVRRFPTSARFAAYAGVAPIEASSGDRRRHRLSRRGNRQLNRTIHTIAVVQRRDYPPAQAYLARKLAEGKSRREALRSLKRQLANVVYRRLQIDAKQRLTTSR